MKYRNVVAWLSVLWLATAAHAQQPVRLIFDTDMDTDVDDAGALAMLHALADRGEVEILATIVSSRYPWSAPATAAINRYYGRDELPIGAPKGEGATLARPYLHPRELSEEFPHPRVRTNDDVEDAVRLYRRILASQSDHSVVVVTVGYVTNLQDLLRSGPDEFSPLDGRELAARKVKKWVCMGGRYPASTGTSASGNFRPDPGAVQAAARDWPTRIVFSGIGTDILTGFPLRTSTPPDNPVRRAYELYLGPRVPTRPSWDQVALLYAARGTGEFFSLQERGYNHIFDDGNNEWRQTPDRKNHVLLQLEAEPDAVAQVIDDLMIQPPALRPVSAVQPIAELAVSAANPRYLAVNGEPVFLIGATHEGGWTPIARTNHDYLRDLDRLREILEEIASPHVRGLVRVIPYDPNNRPDDLPHIVQPWLQLADGRFDLERFDPRWEQRLRGYLEAARERGIVVALEVWDDWSFTRGPRGPEDHPQRAWHGNPFNPANNINYTAAVLPALADQCSQAFYLSLPALQNNPTLYRLQRLYVDHLLSIAGEYPNVLFNISNETRASLTWSRYWAEYLRERLGPDALIGDMPSTDRSGRREPDPRAGPRRGGGECDPELNPWTLLRDHRYSFVDAAQAVNQHEFGPNPVEQSIRAAHRLAQYQEEMAANGVVKPLVVSKDYTNTEPDGIPVIWAKFAGGAASTRFHRPSEGRGQVGPDSYLITDFNFEAIRHLGRFVATTQFWRMRPDPALVTASPAEGALAMATPWDEYVVQLIGGRGPGELVVHVEPGSYWLRWYDPATGRYVEVARPEGTRVDIAAAGPLGLEVPAYEQNLIMHLRKR